MLFPVRRARVFVAVACVCVSFLGTLSTAAQAAPVQNETFLTVFSDSTSSSSSQNRFYHSGNSNFTSSISTAGDSVTVTATGGNLPDRYTTRLTFTAPSGKTLQLGEYERATSNSYRRPQQTGDGCRGELRPLLRKR